MSILIKGMEMPKDEELLCIRIYPNGKVTIDMDLECKQIATAVPIPPHGDLIDRTRLYEQTAEWEASALAKVEQINQTPYDEMDEEDLNEWRRRSVILKERSAFKFDVANAPTIIPAEEEKE